MKRSLSSEQKTENILKKQCVKTKNKTFHTPLLAIGNVETRVSLQPFYLSTGTKVFVEVSESTTIEDVKKRLVVLQVAEGVDTKQVLRTLDDFQFNIWMAGFYEGEGSVCNDISNNNRIRLDISQNDPTPLLQAQQTWGGFITQRVRKSPASSKICVGYNWRLCHNPALAFLNDIKPFLVIPYKMDQIDIAKSKAKKGLTRKFKCYYCENLYAAPSGRRRHIKQIHPEKI